MALDLTTDRLHIGTCYIEVFKNVLHLDATGIDAGTFQSRLCYNYIGCVAVFCRTTLTPSTPANVFTYRS